MESNKQWYASKTVWGGILAIVGGLAGLFGVVISEADIAELSDALAVLGPAVASLVGGIGAIYGRYKAKGKISK